ncbi:Dolichyl pyrophosphate phosphatase and related acid phosphatases [Phaffia rhodozyma]|uniref:Dolichyl pyrophosphate phosphatase and related acid phosphatases n=1 Tax=Phaffia rhodozyma TaxID=264483 RepID=A0A0F7SS79_PHARH|nr:Dolichyl pyrophosphate phosphatase and related acid phosphatases [Phaffia rhodozyma]
MDSKLGQLTLWVLDETNIIVTSATAAWFIRSPSAEKIWFIGGAIAASAAAKIMKHLFRQSRPDGHRPSRSNQVLYKNVPKSIAGIPTYGMPSTHSTTISYFATYIVLTTAQIAPLQSISVLALGTLICWSRIRLGHHTAPQVIAGVGLGITFGFAHHTLWHGTDVLGLEGFRGVGEGYWDLAEAVIYRVNGLIRK